MGDAGSTEARRLLQVLLSLRSEDRLPYLSEHCADAVLRAEVMLLLERHEAAAGSTAAFGHARDASGEEFLPLRAELDEFRIIRQIGTGGMATVYLAEDTMLARLVALKVLPPRQLLSELHIARFRKEAVAVAGLSHANIVPVYRVGHARGLHYIAMEFVEGSTLSAQLHQRRTAALGSRPSTRTRLDQSRDIALLLASIADALDHAHQHQVVHRDVKPSNILIGRDGRARLADFGIAKNLADESITEGGMVPGTFHYMSPEQAAALSTKVDTRSDIFSLGSVLYESLTLEKPFDGDTTQDIVHKIISQEPRALRQLCPDVPRDLETICRKAMEKSPDHRYQTAGQLAADLRAYAAGRAILARPPSLLRQTARWVGIHRTAGAVATILALMAVIGGLIAQDAGRRSAQACRLTLSSEPPGARAYLLRFHASSDALESSRLLGSTPLVAADLDPGRYRVIALADDMRFAEADFRFFERGERLQLALPLTWTDEVRQGMVLVDGGTYDLGPALAGGPFQDARPMELRPFYIDACEVSNGDFLAFMKALKADAPLCWMEEPTEEFLSRPVVTLRPEQMEAYARWRGKRLPTAAEWEAACRRRDGRRFPWGDAPPASWPDVAEGDRRAGWIADAAPQRAHYDRYVSAVRSVPELSSPEGLFHMAGNVEELTSSWDLATGRVVVSKGGSWLRGWAQFDARHSDTRPGQSASFLLGFRCVRSASVHHVLGESTQGDEHARHRSHSSDVGAD